MAKCIADEVGNIAIILAEGAGGAGLIYCFIRVGSIKGIFFGTGAQQAAGEGVVGLASHRIVAQDGEQGLPRGVVGDVLQVGGAVEFDFHQLPRPVVG